MWEYRFLGKSKFKETISETNKKQTQDSYRFFERLEISVLNSLMFILITIYKKKIQVKENRAFALFLYVV